MTDTRAKLKELSAKWRKDTDGACSTFSIDEDSIITGTVACTDCFASREDHEQATRVDELDAILAQMEPEDRWATLTEDDRLTVADALKEDTE
jgi:hypothetical protein